MNVYKYSISNFALSNEQRDFYETNGFLLVRKLVPDYLLDRCNERFLDLCNGKICKNGITLMKDISRMNRGYKGENLYGKAQDILWDDEFYEYARYPKIIDIIESIIGRNVMAMHSMFINKHPDIGTKSSRHPSHQDLHYFPFRPPNLIVASWTPVVPVTKDNGCLYVFPGSHTGKLFPHSYPNPKEGEINKMYHGIQNKEINNQKSIFVEMNKGDTLFFHPLLVHGSGINITQDFRKAISVHYASSDCQYINVAGSTQENIQDEIMDILAKRGIKDVDFSFVWKIRSRLIRGTKANL